MNAPSRDLLAKIQKLKKVQTVYKPEAYSFVLEALDFTVSKLPKKRHVGGEELLDGIKGYALKQFGPMARGVFEYWGVHSTLDFGEIVFDFVESGLLRKQDKDHLEDFQNRFDFKDAFDCRYNFEEA